MLNTQITCIFLPTTIQGKDNVCNIACPYNICPEIKDRRWISSLKRLFIEGKVSVSFHRSAVYAEAAKERENEFLTLERIKLIGEEARTTLVHGIDLFSAQVSNAIVYFMSTRDGVQSACILLVFLLALFFSISFVRHLVAIIFLLVRKALLMPTLVRESRSLASCIICKNRHKIPSIILPQNQQRRLSDLIVEISRARKTGAALKNLLIHGVY